MSLPLPPANLSLPAPFITVVIALAGLAFLCYLGTSLALLAGTFFASRPPSLEEGNGTSRPFISILIAARNEEKKLPGCLASLLQSQYPRDRFEIIVVDDCSEDATFAVAQRFANAHTAVRVLTAGERLPGSSGKSSALAQGAAQARGELLLFTDADCLVPPTWLPSLAGSFDKATGLAGAFTLLCPPAWAFPFLQEHHDTIFAKLQTLDWIYLLAIGAGAAGLGRPVSIIGNNFGVRREAYEQIGGHARLGFSIVEDFALMRKIADMHNWRVHFFMNAKNAIFSHPAKTWREFLEQRRRWTAGGREFGGFAKYLMWLALGGHLAVAAAAFHSLPLFALGLGAMLAMDFLLLWRATAALQCQSLLKYFIPFRVYFLLYNLLLTPFFLFPTAVGWKGRRYRWDARRGQMQEEAALK